MGLTSFLEKKKQQWHEENEQKRADRAEYKKVEREAYQKERLNVAAKRGRERAQRASEPFSKKVGGFIEGMGESSKRLERSFGFDSMFGPPPRPKPSNTKTVVVKVVGGQGTVRKKKKQRTNRANSLDWTQW